MHGTTVHPVRAAVHGHLQRFPAPTPVKDVAIRSVEYLPRKAVERDGITKRPSVAYIDVVGGARNAHANARMDVWSAHVGANEVGVISQNPQQTGQKRVVRITGAAQIPVLDAV